jgi:hypothetical protein
MRISYNDMLQTPADVIYGDLDFIGAENEIKSKHNKQAKK